MTQAVHGQVNVSYNHQTLQSEPTHSASFHFNAFFASEYMWCLLCICPLSFMYANKVQQEAFSIIILE